MSISPGLLLPISRQDAHRLGRKRFFTGKPCKRGHNCERFTSNGCCVDCATYKTPDKPTTGFAGPNSCWPPRALIFTLAGRFTVTQMQAALLHAEAKGFLDRALWEVMQDPVLLATYAPVQTMADVAQAQMVLDAERERGEALARAQAAMLPTTEHLNALVAAMPDSVKSR